MKALITQLKPFATHDGPGIRTTVFFKGCPLKCIWCHNPEGIDFGRQVAFFPELCLHCGSCRSVCREKAHDGISFDRKKCIACGDCAAVCPGQAMRLYGAEVTVESLLAQLLADRDFYESSGGGVTLSGGECLAQADFCSRLLQALKKEGIHTAVDTCGFVPRSALEKVAVYTDLFLYDLKAIDPAVHKACTGQDNRLILENLQYLDALGKEIWIRVPFVPGHNDDQMEMIGAFVKELKHVRKVELLPYHNLAGNKYRALGMENTLPQQLPEKAELETAKRQLRCC